MSMGLNQKLGFYLGLVSCTLALILLMPFQLFWSLTGITIGHKIGPIFGAAFLFQLLAVVNYFIRSNDSSPLLIWLGAAVLLELAFIVDGQASYLFFIIASMALGGAFLTSINKKERSYSLEGILGITGCMLAFGLFFGNQFGPTLR